LEAYPGDASPDSGAERIAEPVEDEFGASAEDAHASAAIEGELAYQTVNLQDEEGAVPAGESEERPISEEPERSTAGEMVEAVPVAEEDSGAVAHEGPSREAGAAAPAGEPAGGPAAESVAEAGPSDEQREAALYPAGGEAAVSPGFT